MRNVASLWDSAVSDWSLERPFVEYREDFNDQYAYYAELAETYGLNLLLAHYTWYSDGVLKKGFVYNDGWEKVHDIELDGVWDAFKVNPETMKIKKEMAENLTIINLPEIDQLAKDKLETYNFFPELVPETKKASKQNVKSMLDRDGKTVLKPRDDASGRGVKVIDSISEFEEDMEDYLVQEFIDSTQGVPGLEIDGVHDLRAVLVSGNFVTGFVRQPEEGYISNVARGAEIDVLEKDDFPDEAVELVEKVISELEDYNPHLLTADMIYDYESEEFKLIELNSKPGMSFYGRQDLKRAKTLIAEQLFREFSR